MIEYLTSNGADIEIFDGYSLKKAFDLGHLKAMKKIYQTLN